MKPLFRRERADRDVVDVIAELAEQDPARALAFIDALGRACRRIEKRPGEGSPHCAHALNLPGLRFVRCGRSPFLVFYMASDATVDVWRVLHERRDIPASLDE